MRPDELALRMAACEIENSSGRGGFAQIILRARAGDKAAFESIVLAHQRPVLMTALRLLGRLEDAEDASQEVFIRLYRYLDRFDSRRDLAPWLYRMTVNVCRDLGRKQARAGILTAGTVRAERSARSVEADLRVADQKRIVEQSLSTLTKKERAAVVLRDIEGLSTKEVARILGSSEGTVRSQVSAARVKIKKFVDGMGGFEPPSE